MFGNVSILLHPEPSCIHSPTPVPLRPLSVSPLHVQGSFNVLFLSGFYIEILREILLSAMKVTRPSDLWFHHSNNTLWKAHITKLFTMQFPPVSYYLVPNMWLTTLIESPQSALLAKCDFTTIQNNGQNYRFSSDSSEFFYQLMHYLLDI
jgi:hypothetical protein